ncbi:unnamed protein product [Haemonchus placei]|uniref:Uncharacterized protein n=1 Tax=Haemonchus placei TaxID=6290 RepID=A0A0N4WHK4_HAEPC|nr:unnamed protein product [Haemonchus placei]
MVRCLRFYQGFYYYIDWRTLCGLPVLFGFQALTKD